VVLPNWRVGPIVRCPEIRGHRERRSYACSMRVPRKGIEMDATVICKDGTVVLKDVVDGPRPVVIKGESLLAVGHHRRATEAGPPRLSARIARCAWGT
jgi:hypothetical protein